ncbi:hypothetical protein UPYG_G00257660 [Umbra pygmaea]|uniref:[histone H3]-lysine(4) N-trimethyltransferase n=1 Tax=Umbra pygmaea TaxID=75934 RepID=A0ABD0W9J1_UMBPY
MISLALQMSMTISNVNCNGFTVEDEELSHMGSAVYPDVALINHSCCPNVIVTYNGNIAEVRAVQKMVPGDEVLTSYIDLLYPTADRNERLRDAYYFTCDCKECKNKSKDKIKLKVRKFKKTCEPEEIINMAMGVCLYMGDWEGAISYGEKVLKPYSVIYPPYSMNVASIYQKLGRLYLGLERKSQGITALKKAMAIMEVAHGKDHQYIVELRKEIGMQT